MNVSSDRTIGTAYASFTQRQASSSRKAKTAITALFRATALRVNVSLILGKEAAIVRITVPTIVSAPLASAARTVERTKYVCRSSITALKAAVTSHSENIAGATKPVQQDSVSLLERDNMTPFVPHHASKANPARLVQSVPMALFVSPWSVILLKTWGAPSANGASGITSKHQAQVQTPLQGAV